MDPIEQMRQQVCEELHGAVTIVGKLLYSAHGKSA